MGTSSITITALTATPTLRGNKLAAVVSATGPTANIPTLMLDTVEFFASTTNDFATATKVVEGNPEALHAGLIEEQVYYYWAKPRAVNGSYGAVFPVSPTGGIVCTTIGQSGLAFGLANGKLVATVAANALTIALKTASGNDPSASDPVYVAFRNATLATGNYQIRAITSALSFTVSSGSTLRTVDATPFRIWILLFDNGGTLQLATFNCVVPAAWSVLSLQQSGVTSAVAEGGAGGADSNFIYASTTITSKSFRLLGFLEWTSGLTTAGTWSAAPDIIQMMSANTMTPGSVLQQSIQLLGPGNTTATIPFDNSIPQSSEGTNFYNTSMQATSPANIIENDVVLSVSGSVAVHAIVALFKGAATDASRSAAVRLVGADMLHQIRIHDFQQALTTANIGWGINCGLESAGTIRTNGTSAGGVLGGTLSSYHLIREIMG